MADSGFHNPPSFNKDDNLPPPAPPHPLRFPVAPLFNTLCFLGGYVLLRKLTKRTTRADHARIVARTLTGEKFTSEQAGYDPGTYFNLRLNACPAAEHEDGSRVLYVEQAFWRTPERPYRQRFFKVKPCPQELNCDVEVSAYAVRDIEQYRNFCDRPKKQRPKPEQVLRDIAEYLTTVHLSVCKRGQQCLYEGSTPPGGFPNSWNGATYCTSDLKTYKNGEIHCWDRAYNEEGSQVWGVQQGPYEFKPRTANPSGSFLDGEFSSTVCDKK